MNHGSPLNKDWKVKKDDELKKFPKPKFTISMATTKKILKKSNAIMGIIEMRWLNIFMENKVQGECLPKSFLSNDLPSEIIRTFGYTKGEQFIDGIVAEFLRQCPQLPMIEEAPAPTMLEG
jgi:hypothetical protein